MGRKKNSFIREFFTSLGNRGKCNACGREFYTSSVTNMKRHLLKEHPELYQEHEKRCKIEHDNKSDQPHKFTVVMSPNQLKNACIGFLTKELLPLSFFDSESFNFLTAQFFDGLNVPRINSGTIMNFVNENCEEIKNDIQIFTSQKVLCLKIDIATLYNRAVMAINLLVVKSKKLKTFTLSTIELKHDHTAEYLKNEIVQVLNNFNITEQQIYAIITDNDQNMFLESEMIGNDSGHYYENILNNITFENVISIRPASHTLQLAVNNFLLKLESNVFHKCRVIENSLKTSANSFSMDIPTYSHSIYSILKKVLNFKEYCIEHLEATEQLEVREWAEVEQIVEVLTVVDCLIVKLRQSSLLLGDFYKLWLEFKTQLRNMPGYMSTLLLVHIEAIETSLVEHDTMYAALFLDPRFKHLLSQEQTQVAKDHLKKIVVHIKNVENPETELTRSLREMDCKYLPSEADNVLINESIRQAYFLIDHYNDKQLDISEDLMEYWESKTFTLPLLRKLALIVHSVSVTQASLDRSLSALKVISGDLQYSLSEENLTSLLMVRLNS